MCFASSACSSLSYCESNVNPYTRYTFESQSSTSLFHLTEMQCKPLLYQKQNTDPQEPACMPWRMSALDIQIIKVNSIRSPGFNTQPFSPGRLCLSVCIYQLPEAYYSKDTVEEMMHWRGKNSRRDEKMCRKQQHFPSGDNMVPSS